MFESVIAENKKGENKKALQENDFIKLYFHLFK